MASLGCLDHLETLSLPLILFGLGSTVLVAVNQIPQYRKILRSKSAEGLSAITLGIGNVASSFNVINLVILHANQVKLCFAQMPDSMATCQPSLLVLYSGLCGFLACFPYYILKMKFSSRGKGMLWGAYTQAFIILTAAMPAILSIMPDGSCERFRDYANVIGFVNTILLCSQYIPQIYACYKFKGAGAVSYATLGFDSFGGQIMVLYRIFGTHERLSSWLPYLVFHTSELVVILVALYFDRKKRKLKSFSYNKLAGVRHSRDGSIASCEPESPPLTV